MGKLAHISEMACRIWKWHEYGTYFYLKNASNLSIIQTFWTFQVSLVHSAGQGVERERNAIIAVLIDLFWCIPGELHQNGFWCQSPCWLWAWLSQLWLLKVQFLHNLLHVLPSITLESGIDLGQGINVGSGKFVKNNKQRAFNKHRACTKG